MRKVLKIFGISLLSIIVVIIIFLVSLIPLSRFQQNLPEPVGVNIDKIAIKNIQLVRPDSGDVIAKQTILLEGKQITAVQADSMPVPSGFIEKDGQGQYLTHALADMHVHIFDRTDLVLYLSYGITHVRNMMGFPMHLKWREEVANGTLIGSTMLTASPTLNHGGDGGPFHKYVENSEAAEKAVNQALNKGYDFIKVYDGITSDQLSAIFKAAHSRNSAVAGHPPYTVKLDELYKSGMVSIEHIEEVFQGLLSFKFDEEKAREIAQNLKENEIAVTITLSAYNHLYRTVVEKEEFLSTLPVEYISPMTRFIGQKQLEGWKTTSKEEYDWTVKKYEFMLKLIQILQDEGVILLLGTDQGPNLTVAGWSLHREMEMLQKADQRPDQILLSGTSLAAPILNSKSFVGHIAPNTPANLVLVPKNPLKELKTMENPATVITQGRWYNASDLQKLRKFGKEGQSPWPITLGRFLDHLWQL